MGGCDDLAALALGRLGQTPLVDQEGSLLLGLGHDPLGFLLGLLDDPLALGIDPLGRADLFGDGDAKLIDEPERRVLIHDDVGRERQLLAVGDERFETLDEEDDVDLSVLLGRGREGPSAALDYGTTASGQRLGRASVRAFRAAAGTIVDTSPPKLAISFTRLELT